MPRSRSALAVLAVALLSLVAAAQATATVRGVEPDNGMEILETGQAIMAEPTQLTGASLVEYAFSASEVEARAMGIGDNATGLTGFPTAGTKYGILDSGRVQDLNTQTSPEYEGGFEFVGENMGAGAPASRGRGFDSTVLKLDVNVPSSANCLALDFRFLSDEYPVFVGSQFNDAFIAEVDSDIWSVNEDGSLVRPTDFAASPAGNPISVNGVGPTAMSPAESAGTYFNAATGLVTTKTPITPGAHSIYLSIFDANDYFLDSAVFLDNLRFISESAATCKPPLAAELAIPPALPAPAPPAPPSNAFTLGSSVKFKSSGSSATISVTVPGPGSLSASSPETVTPSAGAGSAVASAAKGKKKKVLVPARIHAAAAGKVSLTVKLSAAGKAQLKKKHKLTVPITVSFTPDGGTAASQVKKVTFKAPKPKKHAR